MTGRYQYRDIVFLERLILGTRGPRKIVRGYFVSGRPITLHSTGIHCHLPRGDCQRLGAPFCGRRVQRDPSCLWPPTGRLLAVCQLYLPTLSNKIFGEVQKHKLWSIFSIDHLWLSISMLVCSDPLNYNDATGQPLPSSLFHR